MAVHPVEDIGRSLPSSEAASLYGQDEQRLLSRRMGKVTIAIRANGHWPDPLTAMYSRAQGGKRSVDWAPIHAVICCGRSSPAVMSSGIGTEGGTLHKDASASCETLETGDGLVHHVTAEQGGAVLCPEIAYPLLDQRLELAQQALHRPRRRVAL